MVRTPDRQADTPERENRVRSLTREDKINVFRIATRMFAFCHRQDITNGMTDEVLTQALSTCLGTFGGSAGPGRLSTIHTGSGLRIWGGWHIVNHVTENPLFAGTTTIAMAREVYEIANPSQQQLDLL